LDNLCNTSSESLRKVQALAAKPLLFFEGDVRDAPVLKNIFASHEISAVVRFVGPKAGGKRDEKPL
jgi:UDP-glucose 4-epimerase